MNAKHNGPHDSPENSGDDRTGSDAPYYRLNVFTEDKPDQSASRGAERGPDSHFGTALAYTEGHQTVDPDGRKQTQEGPSS